MTTSSVVNAVAASMSPDSSESKNCSASSCFVSDITGSILKSNGSPTQPGLRGRQRAADRLNLIRVMPAQGRSKVRRSGRNSLPESVSTEERFDAIVVGAGVIGLACAWRAAERGLNVLVTERARPGAGASNVAAGMLAPISETTWGEDRLLELGLASHRMWPS